MLINFLTLCRLLGAGLQQDRLHKGRLSTCLAHLDQLAAEIQLHATAVRLGRLAATSNELIADQRGNAAVNSRQGSSFREGKAGAASRLQKYRGSKTDSCLTGSGPRGGPQRPARAGRRKSSVINQLSSVIKTGLKL